MSCGNCAKKASKRSGLNGICGANCHRIGPSFERRLNTPDAKKLASGVCTSFRRSTWVMYFGALTENTKSAGVWSCHSAYDSGVCSE